MAASGHWHDPRSASQNVGNTLGSRPCVRQSRLYREYESGNGTKSLLGQDHLMWALDKKQGAYEGQPVYNHLTADHSTAFNAPPSATSPPKAAHTTAAALIHHQRYQSPPRGPFSYHHTRMMVRDGRCPPPQPSQNKRPQPVYEADMRKPVLSSVSSAPSAGMGARDVEYHRSHAAYESSRQRSYATTSLW